MPQAEHSKIIHAPLPTVWAFVRDMNNWAPLVTGYQRHENLSDVESFWFLKGELGGLTRIAEFKVNIDEWDERGHVRFSLKGVNEPVTGAGSFDAVALAESAAVEPRVEASQAGWFARLCDRFVRWVMAKVVGSGAQTPQAEAVARPSAQAGATEVTFKLTLTAGGMAGMVLNALLAPMMKPVAEDLFEKLAAAIEARNDDMRLTA